MNKQTIKINRKVFNEEFSRVSEKVRGYSEGGLNPDRKLYMMYLARLDAFKWILRMDE